MQMSTSLRTRLAAEIHIADEEIFTSHRKEGGAPKIVRKNSNTGNSQRVQETF